MTQRDEMIKELWKLFPWIPTGQERVMADYIIARELPLKARIGELEKLDENQTKHICMYIDENATLKATIDEMVKMAKDCKEVYGTSCETIVNIIERGERK
jgi:hypothetical protein